LRFVAGREIDARAKTRDSPETNIRKCENPRIRA
jgi:hypothetical protein